MAESALPGCPFGQPDRSTCTPFHGHHRPALRMLRFRGLRSRVSRKKLQCPLVAVSEQAIIAVSKIKFPDSRTASVPSDSSRSCDPAWPRHVIHDLLMKPPARHQGRRRCTRRCPSGLLDGAPEQVRLAAPYAIHGLVSHSRCSACDCRNGPSPCGAAEDEGHRRRGNRDRVRSAEPAVDSGATGPGHQPVLV